MLLLPGQPRPLPAGLGVRAQPLARKRARLPALRARGRRACRRHRRVGHRLHGARARPCRRADVPRAARRPPAPAGAARRSLARLRRPPTPGTARSRPTSSPRRAPTPCCSATSTAASIEGIACYPGSPEPLTAGERGVHAIRSSSWTRRASSRALEPIARMSFEELEVDVSGAGSAAELEAPTRAPRSPRTATRAAR